MKRAAVLLATALTLPAGTALGTSTQYDGIQRLPQYGTIRSRECDAKDDNDMRIEKYTDLLEARRKEASELREKLSKQEEHTLERLLTEERLHTVEALAKLNKQLLEESKGKEPQIAAECEYGWGDRM